MFYEAFSVAVMRCAVSTEGRLTRPVGRGVVLRMRGGILCKCSLGSSTLLFPMPLRARRASQLDVSALEIGVSRR